MDDMVEPSALRIPLSLAQTQLMAQIEAGQELQSALTPSATATDLDGLAARLVSWRDFNRTWLDTNLGGEVAEEYKQWRRESDAPPRINAAFRLIGAFAAAPDPDDPAVLKSRRRNLHAIIDSETIQLQSIYHRLPLWEPKPQVTPPPGTSRAKPGAPIFIVHGSDTLRAERVARTVSEATGRQTIILREQASLGQTLIEKFEHHAASASYAIIVLTPDDEGGPKHQAAHNPRARQNVIFEMGYFYGIRGRSRVSALLHPGVERPSDIDGIAYINFDDNGAWKTELYRELEHADIHVDPGRAI
jgi:hypothetical protein